MFEMSRQNLIEKKIFLVRGLNVILDRDLAELYGVKTKSLNLAVRRNLLRFPEDFMFRLTKEEVSNLRFQNETSSWGGRRYLPYAFTENGVAMLSSVLNSKKAIGVNIQIMRVFTRLRLYLSTHRELAEKLKQIRSRVDRQDKNIKEIIDTINYLLEAPEKQVKVRGFGK